MSPLAWRRGDLDDDARWKLAALVRPSPVPREVIVSLTHRAVSFSDGIDQSIDDLFVDALVADRPRGRRSTSAGSPMVPASPGWLRRFGTTVATTTVRRDMTRHRYRHPPVTDGWPTMGTASPGAVSVRRTRCSTLSQTSSRSRTAGRRHPAVSCTPRRPPIARSPGSALRRPDTPRRAAVRRAIGRARPHQGAGRGDRAPDRPARDSPVLDLFEDCRRTIWPGHRPRRSLSWRGRRRPRSALAGAGPKVPSVGRPPAQAEPAPGPTSGCWAALRVFLGPPGRSRRRDWSAQSDTHQPTNAGRGGLRRTPASTPGRRRRSHDRPDGRPVRGKPSPAWNRRPPERRFNHPIVPPGALPSTRPRPAGTPPPRRRPEAVVAVITDGATNRPRPGQHAPGPRHSRHDGRQGSPSRADARVCPTGSARRSPALCLRR